MNIRKISAVSLMVAGAALIVAAAGFVASVSAKDREAGENAARIMADLEPEIKARRELSLSLMPEDPAVRYEYLFDWQLNPEMGMPIVDIDGYAYCATLEIPAAELELPVLDTLDPPKLDIAPCRLQGSAYTDDLIIGGHNYDSMLGRIRTLEIGSEVLVTDMDGNGFRYRVSEIEILDPGELERLLSGDWDLTLFTCTKGAWQRVAVRCVRS